MGFNNYDLMNNLLCQECKNANHMAVGIACQIFL